MEGEEAASPSPLKLVMLQGPRKGESFEFPPFATIKIGRVIKGNTLQIKDPGISSKHLFIGSQSSCKWMLQDLDSSNGTSLNSSKILPLRPYPLAHGDVVKLGEETSILVQFMSPDKPSQLRRNPRRKVKESAANLTGVEDLKQNALVQERQTGRGRTRKARVLENNESENAEELDASNKMDVRVLRNRSAVVVKIEERESELEKENVIIAKPGRRGRLRKALENAEKVNQNNEGCVILENLDDKITRAGRGRRKKLEELPPVNVDLGLGSRGQAKEQVNEADIDGDKVEEEKKEGLDIEMKCKDAGNVIVVEDSMDLGLNSREEVKDQVNEVDMPGDENMKCENGNGVKENGNGAQVDESENLGKENISINFEKMTLGQWFDYMEENLPKQIIQATEEMIRGMIVKADRVKEYIIEQKKAKAAATMS